MIARTSESCCPSTITPGRCSKAKPIRTNRGYAISKSSHNRPDGGAATTAGAAGGGETFLRSRDACAATLGPLGKVVVGKDLRFAICDLQFQVMFRTPCISIANRKWAMQITTHKIR